jgi:hypothetical protein
MFIQRKAIAISKVTKTVFKAILFGEKHVDDISTVFKEACSNVEDLVTTLPLNTEEVSSIKKVLSLQSEDLQSESSPDWPWDEVDSPVKGNRSIDRQYVEKAAELILPMMCDINEVELGDRNYKEAMDNLISALFKLYISILRAIACELPLTVFSFVKEKS